MTFDGAIRLSCSLLDNDGDDGIDKTVPLARRVKDFVFTIGDEDAFWPREDRVDQRCPRDVISIESDIRADVPSYSEQCIQ